jgi:hypothetical protein
VLHPQHHRRQGSKVRGDVVDAQKVEAVLAALGRLVGDVPGKEGPKPLSRGCDFARGRKRKAWRLTFKD